MIEQHNLQVRSNLNEKLYVLLFYYVIIHFHYGW